MSQWSCQGKSPRTPASRLHCATKRIVYQLLSDRRAGRWGGRGVWLWRVWVPCRPRARSTHAQNGCAPWCPRLDRRGDGLARIPAPTVREGRRSWWNASGDDGCGVDSADTTCYNRCTAPGPRHRGAPACVEHPHAPGMSARRGVPIPGTGSHTPLGAIQRSLLMV